MVAETHNEGGML